MLETYRIKKRSKVPSQNLYELILQKEGEKMETRLDEDLGRRENMSCGD